MRLVANGSRVTPPADRPCRRHAERRAGVGRVLALLLETGPPPSSPALLAAYLQRVGQRILPLDSLRFECAQERGPTPHLAGEMVFRIPNELSRGLAFHAALRRDVVPDEWDLQCLRDLSALAGLLLGAAGYRGAPVTVPGRPASGVPPLIGSSPQMRRLRERIQRFAPTTATVLLEGESGTGKEIVARQIHAQSRRSSGPFVAVNCGALVETLVETEFFGIEDHTATGVRARKGKFELADGGTLFLDELSELAPASQAKLLRVLQDFEVERVGGQRSRRVDTRVLVATNQSLRDLLAQRRIREDLFYRLAGMEIVLPPLRRRGDDVVELAEFFLERHGDGRRLRLRPDAHTALLAYEWPGNVRELERVIQTAVALTGGDEIGVNDLPAHVCRPSAETLLPAVQEHLSEREMSARYADTVLRQCHGNQSEACRRLGISHHTLKARLRELRRDRRQTQAA
jgi:DNA-binding NtrC family response regulator